MKEFHSIEEVVFDSKLYCFAIEFFMVRSRGGNVGSNW